MGGADMQTTIQQIKTAKNRNRGAAGTKELFAFQEHDRILGLA
jgi:hypothetical protein